MKDYIRKVFEKFLGYSYPEETERHVQEWIIEEEHAEEKEKFLYDYWQELAPEAGHSLHISLEAVREKAGISQEAKRFMLRRRWLRAAAVLLPLLLLGGGYLYFGDRFVDDSLLRATVPYGDRQEILLPDGTRVWLNAGTTLQYPETFADGHRTVKLLGEAFFDVQTDTLRPFIVETRKLSVKVLGTEFNVSAYPDDKEIITTLNSGKVAIQTEGEETFFLEPDELLAFHKETKRVTIQPVTAVDYSNWKSGDLLFEKLTADEIARKLERHFALTVKIDRHLQNSADRYTVKFINRESLSQVLEVLGDIMDITYQVKDDNVKLNKHSK